MVKILLSAATALCILAGCNNNNKAIVQAGYIDSIINNYDTPAAVKTNTSEIIFWKSRISPFGDYTNTMRYAAALVNRFHLLGDIADVKKADSLLVKLAADFKGKEARPYFSLVSHYILQHRFKEADSVLQLANTIGLKKYEYNATSFDVNFELGLYNAAKMNLQAVKAANDFGYQFRKSRWMHYSAGLDSAIAAMQKAVTLAANNDVLTCAALSNVGDMYVHAGELKKAAECYKDCLKINTADLHSLTGLGWIALVKDKNDSLAEKIFRFVDSKSQAPDALYKLIAVAAQRGDSLLQLRYAKEFEKKATNPAYGNMYNKYLVQLYTGILNNKAKAEAIALKELNNRRTPQTYAWYAFALMHNGKTDEAMDVYQKHISGKPLEALELYYMGKLMQAAGKNYNAKQYFKEAAKNKYDLMPGMN